jgi:micrococcal nuclease
MYTYAGTLSRVVDGDTLDIQVDLGFNVFHNQRFRLEGVNTPELRGASLEAGKAARQFVVDTLPTTKNSLFINCTGRDKYGRWVAQITFKNSDAVMNLSDLLVEHGHATYTNFLLETK